MQIENLKEALPIKHYISSIHESFARRGERPDISIRSLPEFNERLWGFDPGLYVIGARTSQGKSAFCGQLALDIAGQGIPVLFMSLEMTKDRMVERFFCQSQEVDNYKIRRGGFMDMGIQEKWAKFEEHITTVPLLLTCNLGKTFSEIIELVKNRLRPKPRVVFLDYIQSIRVGSGDSREMLNEYIRAFRQLALEENFVGVLVSQINRLGVSAKTNEPFLYQLKETGTLEEHADVVMLLHWEWFYGNKAMKWHYKINVAKNRNGETFSHEVHFDPEYYRFRELDERDKKILEEVRDSQAKKPLYDKVKI